MNKEISKTNQSKRRTKDPNLVADSIHFVVLMKALHYPPEVHQHIQMVSFLQEKGIHLVDTHRQIITHMQLKMASASHTK